MPPTSRMRRAQRRAQIIGVATEVFAADGYHSTSMDAIARRAGVSKPVLYQHFSSKVDLYLTVLDTAITALQKTLNTLMETDAVEGRRDRVYLTVRGFFLFAVDNRAAFDILMRAESETDESRERHRTALEGFAADISRTILSGIVIDEAEADVLGHALVGMAKAAAQNWSHHCRDDDPREYAELIAALAYSGLSAVDSPEHFSAAGGRIGPMLGNMHRPGCVS